MTIQTLIVAISILLLSTSCSDTEQLSVTKQPRNDVSSSTPSTPARDPINTPTGQAVEKSQPPLPQNETADTVTVSQEQLDREVKDIVDKVTSLPGTDVPPEQLEQEIKGVIKQLDSPTALQAD